MNSLTPLELRIAADLIAIKSENPPGDEREVSDYLSSTMSRIGCSVKILEFAKGRPNLIATAIGRRTGPKIILNGHMDTKPALHSQSGAVSWTRNPFAPTVVGNRLYGLGACDTKGGVAAQVAALSRFLKKTPDFAGTVEFHGVADEENGSNWGTRSLAKEGLLVADFAIVAEPTGGQVSVAQMGNMWAEVVVRGKSAHAGTPWKAQDAIRAMLCFIAEVDALLSKVERDQRFRAHPFLNVGRIEGGDHPGTIPGQCMIRCAVRPLPGQTKEHYLSLLQDVAHSVGIATGTQTIVSLFAGGGLEPNQVDRANGLLNLLLPSLERPQEECFYGASDAQFFGAVGTPAVVMGPGSLEQAHAPDEFAPVSEISEVSARIERFLSQALK